MNNSTCSIDYCSNQVEALDLCRKHYRSNLSDRCEPCFVGDCDRSTVARGMCLKHYKRWKRHGDGSHREVYDRPENAFAARTEWQGDCLVWTGHINHGGYGVMTIDNKPTKVHRYAWEREHGKIPEGLEIDHNVCYNRACCNVKHLKIATSGQNGSNRSGLSSSNKLSGFRNVHKNGNYWIVRVTKDGIRRSYGNYETIEEAASIAEQVRKDLFGDFAGRG